MKTILALVLGLVAITPVQAQYYERPPGYYRPPYEGPRPYYEGERFGRRCEAMMRTPYGPQPLICRIVDPKPVGMECACPPPDAGPGYPPSRFIPGRTIR